MSGRGLFVLTVVAAFVLASLRRALRTALAFPGLFVALFVAPTAWDVNGGVTQLW